MTKQKNIELVNARFPHLLSGTSHIADDANEVVDAGKNEYMQVKGSGNQEGLPFYHDHEYESNFQAWLSSIDEVVQDHPYILFYGFGLGYHVRVFIERYPEKWIFIHEPDEQMMSRSISYTDITSILHHPRLKMMTVGNDANQFRLMVHYLHTYVNDSLSVVTLPFYLDHTYDEVEDYLEQARETLFQYKANLDTRTIYQHNWTQNALYNLKATLMTPSIRELEGRMSGMPAIIVGSGPSLEEDIVWLKEFKKHAIIISAGSSIQALVKHGIEPHLAISIDGGEVNGNVYADPETRKAPLLYAPTVHYSVIDQKQSGLIHVLFNSDAVTAYHLGEAEEEVIFHSTATVTGTAIQAAAYFGCETVLLIGQDLSYPNDQVYAANVKHLDQSITDKVYAGADQYVENVQGSLNRTTLNMTVLLRDIENVIALYPQITFYNLSKIGAVIAGTTSLPAEEAHSYLYPSLIDERMIKHLLDEYENRDYAPKQAEVYRRCQEVADGLSVAHHSLRQIQRLLDKLPERSRTKPSKCANDMVKIEEQWTAIVTQTWFDEIIQTFLPSAVRAFDQQVGNIATEKNIIQKASLMKEHLGRFVNQLVRHFPRLQVYYEETLKRLREHV
ncbi:motility associated factor glycosyltransferase family protein [Marinicrinis sediminis]|uniref:Motility associated factor glycosyltransferase family protein n=1 Tax=Marinicrinis sediminis TaxID=1652465 RepID=A0ABW5RB44_9BACL